MAVSIVGTKFRAWNPNDGTPLAFGKVYTYQAGTNTPKVTYTTEGQETANANPVILNAAGYADIYLDGSYKIVITDADDVEVHTTDPVTDYATLGKEWVHQFSASRYDPNKFDIAGNVSDIYSVGRRVKLNDSTVLYGRITSVSYMSGSGVTRVQVELDSGTISNSLDTAWVNILSANGSDNAPVRMDGFDTSIADYTAHKAEILATKVDKTYFATEAISSIGSLDLTEYDFAVFRYGSSLGDSQGWDLYKNNSGGTADYTDSAGNKWFVANKGKVIVGKREVILIAGVIRYYASGPSGAGWYFLDDQSEDHDPVMMGPVTASGSVSVIIDLNIEEIGLSPSEWTPSGVVCGPDDEYAQDGISVGASVGTSSFTIEFSLNAPRAVTMTYDSGSGTWSGDSQYDIQWINDGLSNGRLEVLRSGGNSWFRSMRNPSAAWRQIVQCTGPLSGNQLYNVQVTDEFTDGGTGRNGFRVAFFDGSGTRVTSPVNGMEIQVFDFEAKNQQVNLNNIDTSGNGNIWIIGALTKKNAI